MRSEKICFVKRKVNSPDEIAEHLTGQARKGEGLKVKAKEKKQQTKGVKGCM